MAEKDKDKMIQEMYRNMLREQEGTDKISKGTEQEIKNLLNPWTWPQIKTGWNYPEKNIGGMPHFRVVMPAVL